MEENLKRKIIGDYKEAFKSIDRIITGKKPNFWVVKPKHYLAPSFTTYTLSLDDKDGELAHYNKICETLEKLLAGEKAEYSCQFRDAPKEIKELLEPIKELSE